MKCPRCASILYPVEYDGVQIQVCSACKGEWLASGELRQLVDHHNKVFSPAEIASIEAVSKEIFTAERGDHDELDCPSCEGIRMEHFNYGDTSGIILHKCLQCNGIWADKGELEKIEALVDGWKQCLNQDLEKYGPILNQVELKEKTEEDRSVSISKAGFVNAILRRFCEN